MVVSARIGSSRSKTTVCALVLRNRDGEYFVGEQAEVGRPRSFLMARRGVFVLRLT